MKNENGFTLIELLAVILILSIIALIAVPTVSKLINDARKEAFEKTLINVEKKVTDTCNLQQLKDTTYTNSYSITNGIISPLLDIKGKLPTSGIIYVNKNCDVTYSISDNNYIGTKNEENNELEIVKNTNDIEMPLYKDKTLNGADPVIDNGMIPVILDNSGNALKANLFMSGINMMIMIPLITIVNGLM